MAEPEQLVLICNKCGARLKLKPMQAKILSEVKCGKCGNRLPTSLAVPASEAPPSVMMPSPMPSAASVAAAAPIVENPKAATPPPVAPASVVSATPPPVVPAIQPPKERTQSIKSRTSNFGPAPGIMAGADGDKPAMLKQKIAELEDEVNVFRRQVLGLQDQIANKAGESGRFQELLQRTADAEEKAQEYQEMWSQKEKDVKKLEARIHDLEHDCADAVAARDAVLNDIKDLLATYHSAEVEAARKRLADLDDRVDRFVALIRQRNVPPPPPPPHQMGVPDAGASGE